MGRKRLLGLGTIAALAALVIALAVAGPSASADGDDDLSFIPEKAELKYPNLGSALDRLAVAVEDGELSEAQAASQSPIRQEQSAAVTIHLSGNAAQVESFLRENGGDPRNAGEDYIEAYVPMTLLGALSEQPGVIRVREIVPPEPTQNTQLIPGRGPLVHGSLPWNQAGYNGQGVKVGVIDAWFGFNGFRDLMGTELPATVQARCYVSIGVFTGNLADCENAFLGDSHGTDVAETVMDIAPESSLYIASPLSAGDLQDAADWMVSQGVSVISYSIGWTFDGPGDGTSPYSVSPLRTVDRAVDGGIVWVNSAGNHAQRTWFGSYSDPDGDGWINFAESGRDETIDMQLDAGQEIRVQLRWEDSWRGATRDFDLLIFERHGGAVPRTLWAGSFDPQTGSPGHVPYEGVRFVPPNDGVYEVAVGHYDGGAPHWIQVTVWGIDESIQHYTENGSINNPAESANPGMLAAGAAPWYDVHTIEDYSSRGPTPDGRVKPEIVGAACGETTLSPLDANRRGFCGTSQAAPHVAGMAVLVKQRFPGYTPAQVAAYLKGNAEQRETPDPNNTWGHGFALLPPLNTAPPEPPPSGDSCGETITADGTASGQWASGCDSQERDGRHARYYTFTLAQQSQAAITLESADADAYLYLRQGEARSGGALHQNDDHQGSTNSRIEATLPAGTYTIEATTYDAGATGNFTLTVTGLGGGATPPEPPPSGDACGETITADGTASGQWASGCDSQERDGRHARYYTFTLAQQSQVAIALESADADTYLYLRQGEARSGEALHQNDDHQDSTDSRIEAALPAGTYTIEATTYAAGATGNFTLTVTGLGGGGAPPEPPEPPEPPPSGDACGETITADGTASGQWASGCDSQERDGRHARYYTFTLAQQSQAAITLESSDADAYLYLRQGEARSGGALHQNDDHQGSTNSRIEATLPAGTYTIEATTYDAGATGNFTLTVSGLAAAAPPPPEPPEPPPPSGDSCGETITADGAASGQWASGCDSQERDGRHARYYTFTLAQQSQVAIALESADADAYLYLRQGEARSGGALHQNDDHQGSTNSRIEATLPAGTYTIEATTYDAGSTGNFTLTLSGLGGGAAPPEPPEPPPPSGGSCGETITTDGTASGQWASGCDSQERDGRHARYYTFTLAQQSQVAIALESADADTYLYLRQGEARSGGALHQNDDHQDSTDSRIEAALPAGTYTIEATTYDAGTTGNFTLTVTGLGVAATPPEPPSSDKEILVALYNATGGPGWSRKGGWLTDESIGDWDGVTTDRNGRVTRLWLSSNQLSGEMPAELGNLANLQVLDLSFNQLSGEIPPELGNLASLEDLHLARNQLSGEIPPDLGRLANLVWLALGENQLRGEIPAELGNLASLQVLQFNENQLRGEIPAELGNLANLGVLQFNENQLSEEIPPELGNLASLQVLNLSGNQLRGEIPSELGNLANLNSLYLSGNRLTGCVPAGLRDVRFNDFDRLGLPFCGP